MRWIVGDVQGCAAELEALLEATRFDEGTDELWCIGDVINRGPDSLAAVRLWHDLGGRGVLGNHEVYACRVHSGRSPRKPDTLDELFSAPDRDEIFRRLRSLPVLVHLPGDANVREAWIVHAGLHPAWHDLHATARRLNAEPHDDDWLESPEVSFATRVRCCTPTGERSRHNRAPEDCPPPSRPWEDFYDGDALIVHGHWAWRGIHRGPNTLGLDSGCVYGGPLSAWCQEEDRIVQVDSKRT